MVEIDFSKIRPLAGNAHKGFEELVCQLGRRESPDGGTEFRRVEGAGGDGGVESYWLNGDGRKTGYQAKYHLKSRDIDWSSLDNSVATALTNHPELDHYVVAMPCDLTDRTGKSTKAKTGWQLWDAHKTVWEKWAKQKRRKIKFEVWTASDLRERLLEESNAGLVRFWFDLPRFDTSWMLGHVESAIRDLDERYHPEDHVDVEISKAFDGLRRTKALRDELRVRVGRVVDTCRQLQSGLASDKDPTSKAAIQELDAAAKDLRVSFSNQDNSWLETWPLRCWSELGNRILLCTRDLQSAKYAMLDSAKGESKAAIRYRIHLLQKCIGAAHDFSDFLQSQKIVADQRRRALIVGAAGTGKSHLFADAARMALKAGGPALLFLGQHFRDADPWPQILSRLDLDGYSRSELLGALNSAAEAAGTRALILIDALNEGSGLQIWRNYLPGLLEEIGRYPYLSIAVNCRSEYAEFVVPAGCLKEIVEFDCRGFETPEEQDRAARQYLEKRNIVRPATPWLAPEFSNPLFLRACCTSLAREGKKEFPRGLRGITSVFEFYLDTAGRHIDPRYAGTSALVAPTKSAILKLAAGMTASRKDFVSRPRGKQIVDQAFRAFAPPGDRTWLELLRGAGLIRFDPDPVRHKKSGAVVVPNEVVRFSFQRFSDYLIAEALLKKVSTPRLAFKKGGVLGFLHDGKAVFPSWQGLFYALATQLPEKFPVELVDVLPGGVKRWWHHWVVRHSFEHSFLWRSPSAFRKRTQTLLNMLKWDRHEDPRPGLMLQLAVSSNHPWNADTLTKSLKRLSLPDRDAVWSVELGRATGYEEHPANRLVDWAWRANKSNSDDETLRLTALALVWLLTTPSRPIRDRATKALTCVLLERPNLFPVLIPEFVGVDDPYLVERLLAAGFGASCALRGSDALRQMAQAVFDHVFKNGSPPVHLLARDYALGIIERASVERCLPREIALSRCLPPYRTNWPSLSVSKATLKRKAKAAGGGRIEAMASDWSDFGCYVVDSRIGRFAAVKLKSGKPLSPSQMLNQFERECVSSKARARVTAYRLLRKAMRDRYSAPLLGLQFIGREAVGSTKVEKLVKKRELAVQKAETAFRKKLTAKEDARYKALALPKLFPDRVSVEKRSIARLDKAAARRWVAGRAYDMGWTEARFGDDRASDDDMSRSRASVERIGKKYQWIALHELLARLGDHLWLLTWNDAAKPYETPCDLEFSRDIDPTVFQHSEHAAKFIPRWSPQTPELPATSDKFLLDWPFRELEMPRGPELLEAKLDDGDNWLVLYSFVHVDETADRAPGLLKTRRSLFYLVSAVIVDKSDTQHVLRELQGHRLTDPTSWNPPEVVDSGFLLEAGWRRSWTEMEFDNSVWGHKCGKKMARPLIEYHWESHLDASLPDGQRVLLPGTWLVTTLGLRPRPPSPRQFEDSAGRLLYFDASHHDGDGPSAALVHRNEFLSGLAAKGLECLWIVAGERSAYVDGSRDLLSYRYHSGVYRLEGKKWVGERWFDDEKRSPSSSRARR